MCTTGNLHPIIAYDYLGGQLCAHCYGINPSFVPLDAAYYRSCQVADYFGPDILFGGDSCIGCNDHFFDVAHSFLDESILEDFFF